MSKTFQNGVYVEIYKMKYKKNKDSTKIEQTAFTIS